MNTFKISLVLKFSFIMYIARGRVAGLYKCVISRGHVEILSHTKVTAGPWVSSFTLPHIPLSQGLSLNQNSPLWPGWLQTSSGDPSYLGSPVLELHAHIAMPNFLHGYRGFQLRSLCLHKRSYLLSQFPTMCHF